MSGLYAPAAGNGALGMSLQSRRKPLPAAGGRDPVPGADPMPKTLRASSALGSEVAPCGAKDMRCLDRRRRRLALTLSIFNRESAFQAELVDYGEDGLCAETGCRLSPGTSIFLRVDAGQAFSSDKDGRPGPRTTALGEVKWCREIGKGRNPRFRVGIRYYQHY